MGRMLLGMFVGAVLVVLGQGLLKGNFWRYMGQIDGHSEVFAWVSREFGVAGKDARMVEDAGAFAHKCSLLVVVEVNGVRTVRVVP